MKVLETSYLAVPSGDNTNFYRITIKGNTRIGVSNYDSGWFPAYSVDRLYGAASTDTDRSRRLVVEEDLRKLYDDAIAATTRGYLQAAQNPDTSEDRIAGWLTAQRRVRAVAGDGVPLPDGAVEVEYDPSANIHLRHSGEKRVFVLASNPTDVIDAINGFAQSEETGASVLRLAEVIRQQRISETDQAEAVMEVEKRTNGVIVSQIDGVLEALAGDLDKDALQSEVEALLLLIESAQ